MKSFSCVFFLSQVLVTERELCVTCSIVVNPDCAYNGVVVLYNGMLRNIVKLCVTFLSDHT